MTNMDTRELGLIVKDAKVVVSSRMVAQVFEKEHNVVLRSIRELGCSEEFGRCNFAQSSYVNEQNREMPEVLMTRDGFTFLAMGFTGSEASRWKEAYINAFNAMESKLLEIDNIYVDAPTLPAIVVQLEASIKMASLLGLDKNQAILTGNKVVRKIQGVDCMALCEITHLQYEPNIQYLTPMELGNTMNLSAMQVNKMLEEKGFQKETRDHKKRLKWVVTETGKQHSRLFDTGKFKSDGTPVQQVKWSESAIKQG